MDHKKGDFIRAMMEGVGYGLYDNFEMMKKSGIKINLPMNISEGGAKSKLWRQIIADILNVPCKWRQSSRGAPVGSAINAGVGVGVFKDYSIATEWNFSDQKETILEPISQNNEIYMKYMRLYRELYQRNKDLFNELSQIRSNV